jgi:antitoxin (DNA-binding transcriptional repressor) of toxin-antitoxin stability system
VLGQEIEIKRNGAAVARLVPARPTPGRRTFGFDRGRFAVPDDFDAPLPDHLTGAFER